MAPEFDTALADYLAARWQHEQDRVTAVWDIMTRRERELFRSAAVMASVRANMRTGSRAKPPPDSEVVFDAISSCLSMPDLYPAIARLERRAAHRPAPLHVEDGNGGEL